MKHKKFFLNFALPVCKLVFHEASDFRHLLAIWRNDSDIFGKDLNSNLKENCNLTKRRLNLMQIWSFEFNLPTSIIILNLFPGKQYFLVLLRNSRHFYENVAKRATTPSNHTQLNLSDIHTQTLKRSQPKVLD